VGNVTRVLAYRLALRLGLHPVQRLCEELPRGPFFTPEHLDAAPTESLNTSWWNDARCFGRHEVPAGEQPPLWHRNPLLGTEFSSATRPWWELSAFAPELGDIKTVWEASRFDWVLAFAQRARRGDEAAIDRLNSWLLDWCESNPAFLGPNWMCGQEASIRVLHLVLGAYLLGQAAAPSPALVKLVRVHLRRIGPTMSYAIGQDNNHGTSEAAALFVGGSWLASLGEDSEAASWASTGRHWLEERVAHLIDEDGTLSQYSVTYQRVVLDTLSLVEWWRRELALVVFSERFVARACAATHWLHSLVQRERGDAPNLGANDGARFFPLDDCAYRDFRPSVQLAATLFLDRCAYSGEGEWNTTLLWLGLSPASEPLAAATSCRLDGGGLFVLRSEEAMALLRYPRYRFRPSHCDALHVDLWLAGENLLRDGGSYSYAFPPDGLEDYFPGTRSHNTIQFDGREQMPRISRFLWGDWLDSGSSSVLELNENGGAVEASYMDSFGARHCRRLSLSRGILRVVDQVSGFRSHAVLRWRLRPGDWALEEDGASLGAEKVTVRSESTFARLELVEGWESQHYLERTALPVLEVECQSPAEITTEYRW